MFKRRKQRSYAQLFSDGIYPRGGWTRAVSYVLHRLRRLPDPPHKIARGIAAGIFICFMPFFGLHIILAMLLAYMMQGNILAAIMATFFGNPITFPIIATLSIELGSWMLGTPNGSLNMHSIVTAFSDASVELWYNFRAMFNDDITQWNRLGLFYQHVFKPYFVGGMVPGVLFAVCVYIVSRPLIAAYQKRRIKRLKMKYEKRRLAAVAKADAARK
ncbi:MAG: DUF2062 domain-containing protein [Paracoccaceae bacterium]